MFRYTCLPHTHAGFIYCVLARVGCGLARPAAWAFRSVADQCRFARWASEPETAEKQGEMVKSGVRFYGIFATSLV